MCYYAIWFMILVFSYACLHTKHCKEVFEWNLQNWKENLLIYLCYCYLILSRAVVPLIQGFEDVGDFTVSERLKTSLHVNLIFYLIVGSIGLFGFILLIMMHKRWLVLTLLILVILKYIKKELLHEISSKILLPRVFWLVFLLFSLRIFLFHLRVLLFPHIHRHKHNN